MGPDEHNAVREALDSFADLNGPAILAYDLGDARSAVLLRAVNARRAIVGAVMVIMDTRGIKQDEKGVIRMMTPKLQRALSDFASMRPDTGPALVSVPTPEPQSNATNTAPPPVKPATAAKVPGTTKAPTPGKTPPSARGATAAAVTRKPPTPRAAAPVASTPQSDSIAIEDFPFDLALEESIRNAAAAPPSPAPAKAKAAISTKQISAPMPPAAPGAATKDEDGPAQRMASEPSLPASSKKGPSPSITPEIDRLHAALRRSPIALFVQRLVPLTKGSQLKRYEVLLRSKTDDAPNSAPQAMLKAAVDNGLGSMIDRRVVTELISWLVHHPDVWENHAVMFSVNLTTTALHDEHFIKFVGLCLAKSSLPKAMIAFEIDVATAIKFGDRINDVSAALHRLGCPMVLDDFGLRTECFDLLRLPAVRYIKLAPEITAKMRSDKLSQASITAVVQMARVLGMHTVAKRTETAAEQEWLTALGVDFIQSHALAPPIAIESLSKAKAKS
jgi:EAL domain-containing protein (putative c-di-GMP-specific phosphodiesterase class I)